MTARRGCRAVPRIGKDAIGPQGPGVLLRFCLLRWVRVMNLDDYRIADEPFYRPVADEIALFEAAYGDRLPVMLKGPTGCGKTRFVEHMAWRLGRPLITVACHEDMTASDLAGRFLLSPEGTVWHDGPLTTAVRHGAICYLDEIVEARQDTTVVIHPLTDARRVLPLDKHNEVIQAHADFALTISYNPGYQSAVKDLKESTKQRFVAIEFSYPERDVEAAIVAREAGVDGRLADTLVAIGARSRNLRGQGLDEGASTRMLIHAGRLVRAGMPIETATRSAIVLPITDDADMREALSGAVAACIA
jgi:nitric oxide reductase NorQ protein